MKTSMLLCSLIASVSAAELKVKVVGVKSGSEIEVLRDGAVIAVRIQGIECPAVSSEVGKSARRFTAKRTFMEDVDLAIYETESEGALVGRVTLPGGMNLGAELIKGGLARWDKQGGPEAVGLAMLEQAAHDAGLGLWSAASNDDDEEDSEKEVLVKRQGSGDGSALTTVTEK